MATVGGLQAPALAFQASAGGFGVARAATVELAGLKGEPTRDGSGRIPVSLAVAGESVWSGYLERLTRSDGGVTIEAACGCAIEHSGEERVLSVRDLAITTYGSWSAAPVAIAVRGIHDHIASRVGTGDIGALATLTTKTQRTFGAVEAFAERLAAKVASEIMLAEATVTDRTVVPGARVRLEHDKLRDREFTVARVVHRFSDDVLTTNITALYVPSAPIQLERGGFATIPKIGPLCSVLPKQAAQAGGLAA